MAVITIYSISSLCSQSTPTPPHTSSPAQITSTLMQPLKLQKTAGKDDVLLGATLPLKGETAIIGTQILDGMTLFFNKAKKEDPTSSISVSLSALDDHADITKIRKNAKKLLKKSPLFISLFGLESMTAVQQFINNKSMAAFFPLNGTKKFRSPEHSNLVFFRPPQEAELAALIHYSVNELNKKKIAVFYEASEWGEECYEIIKNILHTKYHLKPVAHKSYQQKTVNIIDAVKGIASAAPNAIICIAQARPAYNFISQILNKGLHKTTFLGLGELFTIQATLQKSRGINIITSSTVPNPTNSSIQLAKEYRADMKKYYPNKPLTPFSFEGYINAAIFYAALTYTQQPISAQKIINVISNFNKFDFKNFPLSFDIETRALSSNVWINTNIQNKWLLSSPN